MGRRAPAGQGRDDPDLSARCASGNAAASRTSATASCGSSRATRSIRMSRGRLCPRGTGAVGTHYDPDRLQKPLIRRGERGKEEWTAVTWDEALDHVADRMKKIAASTARSRSPLWKHGIGPALLRARAARYGAINNAAPSFAQCRGPRDVGFTCSPSARAWARPSPPTSRTPSASSSSASHLGENMHNTQVQEFAQAVGGAVADHRRRPALLGGREQGEVLAADQARHRHRAPPRVDERAGERGPLRQGVRREARPRLRQVRRRDHGHTRPNGPQARPASTPRPIRATAREFASTAPRRSCTPAGASTGTATTRSAARHRAPHALLGNWGRKGGLFLSAGMKIAGYPLPEVPRGEEAARWTTPTARASRSPTRRSPPAFARRRSPASPTRSRAGSSTRPTSSYALPNRGETLEAIDEARPPRRRRHAPERDRRLRRRRAARNHVPRAPRRPLRRLRPHRVDVAAPARRRRAARPEARLVDREAAREQARASASACPSRTWRSTSPSAIEKSGYRWAELKRDGVIMGAEAADHRRGRPRARVRHAVEEGRVLVRAARQGGLRPGAEVHGARGGARRPLPARHRARAGAHVQPHADQSATCTTS